MNEKIILQKTIAEDTFTLEKVGNLYFIRENNKTLKMDGDINTAKKYYELKTKEKGGETMIPDKNKAQTVDPKDVDEALSGSESMEVTPDEDPAQDELATVENNTITELYGSGYADVGTEEMNQEDQNTPYLVLMQDGTKIDGKKVGWFYRSDTKEMVENIDVNFVYVTTKELLNQKNEPYTAKYYFGFYADTNEPFKFKVKGWGLAAHRELQTEVSLWKRKLRVPMFALTVRLTSEHKTGTAKDGSSYDIEKVVMNVIKDPEDKRGLFPLIEKDPERVGFLMEAANRFKIIAPEQDDDEVVA